MFGLARDTTLALTTGATSIYLLFMGEWYSFLASHLISTGFSGLALASFMKVRGTDQRGLWLLSVMIIFVIPGFSFIGLPACLVYAASPPKKEEVDLTMVVDVPALPFKPLQFDSKLSFSRGGLFEVLERSGDAEKRLIAVMATNRMPPRQAIPLLKIAMRDSVDDVRLLAYSIKDKHESEINERIKELTDGLKESDVENTNPITLEQASALRSLAFAYWELVYLELAEGQIKTFCLKACAENSQRALHRLLDAPVAVLLARAKLALGDTKGANKALDQALSFGIKPEVVAPHRAEIAFVENRFDDVKLSMEELHDIRFENLKDVHDYWVEPA